MERLLLVLLTTIAFGVRLGRLLGSQHPLGTDGYYYVVQVESLLSEGHQHVPDASWVHGWLAALSGLAGEPVLGVKLGAALLAAACVPAAWLAGRALGGGRTAAWILAAWAAASPTLTHLAGDFPKNLGLAAPWLLLVGLVALGWARPRSWRAGWRPLVVLVLALMVATAHRTGAALLLLACLGWAAGWLGARLGRGPEQPTGAVRWGLVVVICCCLAFSLGSMLLPAWLHPADLARLEGRFALAPHLPAPWGWLSLRPTGLRQVVELSVPWLALAAAAPAWFGRPCDRARLSALALPLFVLLFPGWRVDELDLGYRLSLLAPLVAMPLLLLLLAPRLPGGQGRPATLLLLICFALAPGSWPGIDPATAPPYGRYGEVIEALPRPLPPLIIAHQGMSFYYDHITGQEAMAWAPEPELDRREVGRVVHGVRAGEWLAFAPPVVGEARPLALGHGYHYVREDLWERFVGAARAEGDPDLQARLDDWRNPLRVRPAHMLRGRDLSPASP
jgi:hypothetical protein